MDLLGELRCGRTAGTKEAVAVAERTAHRCRVIATDPERRGRVLGGVWLPRSALGLPQAAAGVDARGRAAGPPHPPAPPVRTHPEGRGKPPIRKPSSPP